MRWLHKNSITEVFLCLFCYENKHNIRRKNVPNIVAQNISREHVTRYTWLEPPFYKLYNGSVAIFIRQLDLEKINENWNNHVICDGWVTPRGSAAIHIDDNAHPHDDNSEHRSTENGDSVWTACLAGKYWCICLTHNVLWIVTKLPIHYFYKTYAPLLLVKIWRTSAQNFFFYEFK